MTELVSGRRFNPGRVPGLGPNLDIVIMTGASSSAYIEVPNQAYNLDPRQVVRIITNDNLYVQAKGVVFIVDAVPEV